mgnify:CR=1 FL=1
MKIINTTKKIALAFGLMTSVLLSSQSALADCAAPDKEGKKARMELTASDSTGATNGPRVEFLKIPNGDGGSTLSALGIRFRASEDAPIDYDSIRFLYGTFRFDITDKIKDCFDLTGEILVEGASLPSGTHKLKIEVADTSARMAKYTVKFRVL